MTKQLAGSACNVRFAGFQQLLCLALCGVALAGLLPQRSLAQSCSGSPSYSPDFSSNQGCLQLNSGPNGGASFKPGAGSTTLLQLTRTATNQVGSAWYTTPQPVANSFSTTFTFQLTDGSADGFAFVVQNSPSGTSYVGYDMAGCALGFAGDPLDVCGSTSSGVRNSLAVGFKTYNDGTNYPSANSVFIASNGTGENCENVAPATDVCVNAQSVLTGIFLADGNVHTATVTYTTQPSALQTNCPDPAGCLDVILDGTDLFPHGVSFTMTSIGLTNNSAYVGFTGATGASVENNDILSWVFSPQSFGEINVCTPRATMPAPCSSTIPVTFTMAATTTIGSVQVVTQGTTGLDFQQGSGGTCSGTISAGNSCTVNVTFTPIAPGLRQGAVELLDGGGNVLATKLIYGIGQGPAAAFNPGVQAQVGSGLNQPQGVAVDAAGDVFISNYGLGNVFKVAHGGVQTTVPASGLASPYGVAVDGAGNVFIADPLNHRVVKVTPGGVQTTVGSVGYPYGVAVDGAGDVFIVDSQNTDVVKVTPGGVQTTVHTSGLTNPYDVAVDGAGDVFISEPTNHQVVKVTPGGVQTTVPATGLACPYGVAVDAAGDVFIADPCISQVVEVTPGGVQTTIPPSGLSSPISVAVDGMGDVFTGNSGIQGVVTEVQRSQPPSLSFAQTTVGSESSDSPQMVSLQNIGNQTLNAISPGLLNTDPTDFIQVSGPGTPADCTTTFSLVQGAACDLSVDFDPQSSGTIQGSAQFFDNALNNPLSSQSVALTGTGVPPNYTLTVTKTGSGPGAVTSGDGLINCSYANGSITGSCSESYASGTPVSLTAMPTGTSTFLGWGGACANAGTSPTCNVSMTLALNVTASFAQQSFGNVNVCAAGQSKPSPCNSTLAVTFNLTVNTTIGAIQVVTQGVIGLDFTQASGSTCTGAISAGNSCYVNVNFAPLAPGMRMGAVNLFDNGGNLLATAPIYGIGQAPEAAFTPYLQTLVPTSGLGVATGIAVNGSGNVFISDQLNNRVLEVTPGGLRGVVATSGLNQPDGLAVDGAGDLFIADNGNNRVVKVPAGGGTQITVGSGLNGPIGVAVDGAFNVFIADSANGRVVEVPAGGGAQVNVASGLNNPEGVAVDATGNVFIGVNAGGGSGTGSVVKVPAGGGTPITVATGFTGPQMLALDGVGDLFVADGGNGRVVELPAGGGPQVTLASGFGFPWGVTVDGTGDVFLTDPGNKQVVEINRSIPPSLSFALTAVSNTSADSPHLISLQNIGNQPLTGTLALTLGANFAENSGSSCSGSGFSLIPGASCSVSFSFTPQSTGLLTGAADFSDNTLNLPPAVVLQAVNLSGSSSASGSAAGVVPNVVGMTQSAATTALTAAGLTLGTVTTQYSDSEPYGSVIGQNPTAGSQANLGTAVALVTSVGEAPAPAPNPLSLLNNYFVTGDYAAAGVTLRGTGTGGVATGTINIPDSTTNPGVSQGVPDGADIIDGYLYWETLENTPSPSGNMGTFDGYAITGQQIGTDTPFTDGTLTGTLRVYRADVNTYFPVYSNGSGVRSGSGAFKVSLPDSGGSGFPVTEGASLVVIYRVMSPNFPLKSVVIYDGSAVPTTSTSQNVKGFYDALGGAGESTILSYASGAWSNSYGAVSLSAHASQYSAPLNAGTAYGAVIFSTSVTNSDNDGILDAWKSGPPAGDFFAGQPGYYDVKTQSWVPLPGAQHGEKDLFVQLDYMCGAVLASGACDPSQENLFPSPDASGNDPLAIVKNSFAASGVVLHLEIGNAVPESTCTDNTSANPPQLCEFPGQPGVIDWKNSLEISKVWPRNFASCAAGGDCTARFPYGQKDSYHYVLFGHSLAIPAWNTPYQTLTSISVVNGVTTLVTTNRGAAGSINYCPSRFTISGVQGNPSLNGIYNTSSCPDGNTIILLTPGVPNWTYPNNTLPEPEIGLTSGTVTSISGYSDLGGQDSAVTLGLWETAPNQNMATRANVIAGTMFHEIGHPLGLTHGGRYYDTAGSYVPTYEANCKPNFQSTMNYLFQLDGVGPAASVAFSNQTLNTLLPGSLGSVTQLTAGTNPATFSTSSWYTSTQPSSGESAATMHCDGTPLTGDTGYRINASIAPIPTVDAWSTGQNITFDSITNNDGVSEIEGMPYTQLRGYNDVTNIDLRQVGATGGQYASLSNMLSFASPAAPIDIAPGGTVTLGVGGTVALGSGGTATLTSGENATLSSGGTIALGSGGSVTLNNGGTVTLPAGGGTIALGSGGTVALGSGGTVTLSSAGTIALGSGGTIALGSGGTVTLSSGGTIALGSGGSVTIPSTGGSYTLPDSGGTITLTSGGIVALGSGGTIALGSGGTIALGSGGTVALGSGGTIALGSGGTIALGSGGTIALGSGGNITMGSGGTIALGSGGTIALGSGGTVALGSGGTVALGSGGNVTIGSGGVATLSSGGTVALGSGGTIALGSGGSITLSAGGTIALGSGGTIALGSGGTIALGSGGTIALGSGGVITLNGGGTIALGSGGTVALGSGGTIALGSGGVVALGSGGVIALGSGGTVALGSGGTIALGSGGTVALGSGGATTNELDYTTANSVVRPPVSPSETPMPAPTPSGQEVVVNWTAPIFGVVQTYSIYRSSDGATPILIGSVSGMNGNPPATTFTDTNPDLNSTTVVYTIVTTLVPDTNGNQRQSPPSPPAVLKNNQTIVIPQPWPSSAPISSSPVVLQATAESNDMANMLQVSFSASGNCSVGGQSIDPNSGVTSASVILNATGSCTITASQTGSGSYNAADSVSGTFSILPAGSNVQSQTITFPQLQNVQYGGTFSFSATASSGQPVTFSASGPCTTSGTTTGVGLCSITASAAANSTYSTASATQSFTITPAVIAVKAASPTITYGASIPALNYSLSGFVNNDPQSVVNGAPSLSTTANSSSGVGQYPITVATGTLSAANYDFLYVPGTLTIQQANQAALVLSAASPLSYGQSEPLSVTGGSSGGAVSYTVTSGPCMITGAQQNQLTATSGTGSCTVSATMAGNSNYNAVTSTPPTKVTLGLASPTITFAGAPASAAYQSQFPVASTTNASTTAVITASGACTIAGSTVTMTSGTGACSLTANWAADNNYAAATVTQSTSATKIAPTVTFTGAPASAAYQSKFPVASTTNASTTAVITASGACTIAGSTVTMTSGTGACSLLASWTADNNYSGTSASQSTAATLAAQVITFTTKAPASAAYNSSFTVAATGGASGNAVTFTSSGSCSNLGATYTMTSYTGTCSVIANQAGNTNYAAAPQTTQSVTATFTGSVPASGTACNGAYTGTFQGNLTVVSGQSCVLVGGGASGNITATGGNLILSSAAVGGNVTVNGGTFSIGPSTNIKGNVQIQSIPSGLATNRVCATTVSGNLEFQSNGTSVLIGSGSPSCAGNVIKGSLQVLSNSAATTLDGNTVSGNLQDQSNTGPTQVISNVITGTLQCSSNTSITGSGNTATSKQGQCARF